MKDNYRQDIWDSFPELKNTRDEPNSTTCRDSHQVPTTKPRLAITLTPEARSALERLTEASGIASSQFVSKLIHDAVPMLDAMTRSFTEAKKSPMRAAEIMREALNDAHVDLAQHSLALDAAITRKKRKMRKRPTRD